MSNDDDKVIPLRKESPKKPFKPEVIISIPAEEKYQQIQLVVHGVQMIQNGKVIAVQLYTTKEKADEIRDHLKKINENHLISFRVEQYPIY